MNLLTLTNTYVGKSYLSINFNEYTRILAHGYFFRMSSDFIILEVVEKKSVGAV